MRYGSDWIETDAPPPPKGPDFGVIMVVALVVAAMVPSGIALWQGLVH